MLEHIVCSGQFDAKYLLTLLVAVCFVCLFVFFVWLSCAVFCVCAVLCFVLLLGLSLLHLSRLTPLAQAEHFAELSISME